MKDREQQLRLRHFWGAAIFSLGVLWGVANLVYCPIAALTSIVGSSWFEVFVIAAGGALSFCASVGAFYRRPLASRALLAGGIMLLLLIIAGQAATHASPRGLINLLLLFLSGIVPIVLGIFGLVTERNDWPALRGTF